MFSEFFPINGLLCEIENQERVQKSGFGMMKAILLYIPIVTLELSLVVTGQGISILNH